MTTFYPWLRQLAAAGQGPVSLSIDRGLPFKQVWTFGAVLTGYVLKGSLRLAPDTPDPTLADFSVTGPVIAGGMSTFTVELSATQTGLLPADVDGDGIDELAFDILLTPPGGTQVRAFGGVATVAGKVSNVG